MNSENIKQLIELFGQLGASSKEAFLWFIIIDFAKFMIGILLAFLIVRMGYALIIGAMAEGKCEVAIGKLRDHANLPITRPFYKEDLERIVEHYTKPKS